MTEPVEGVLVQRLGGELARGIRAQAGESRFDPGLHVAVALGFVLPGLQQRGPAMV